VSRDGAHWSPESLSTTTIEAHLGNIYRKLGVRLRIALDTGVAGERPATPRVSPGDAVCQSPTVHGALTIRGSQGRIRPVLSIKWPRVQGVRADSPGPRASICAPRDSCAGITVICTHPAVSSATA